MKTTIIITVDEDDRVRSIISGMDNQQGRDLGEALDTVAHQCPEILGAVLYTTARLLSENDKKGFEDFKKSIEKITPKLPAKNIARFYQQRFRNTSQPHLAHTSPVL